MIDIEVGDLVLVRNVKKYPEYNFTGIKGEVIKIYDYYAHNECSVAIKFPNMRNGNSKYEAFYFEIEDIIAVSKPVDPTHHTNELHFVQEKEIKHKENPYAKIGPKYNYAPYSDKKAVKGEKEATKMIKIGDTVIVKNVKKYPEHDFTGMQGKVVKIYNRSLVCSVKFPNIDNKFYFDIEDLIPIPDMCGKIFYEHTYDCMNGPAHVINTMCEIKTIKFNPPATIVFWSDGTKTVVKAENEEFDPEKGMAMAICKKVMGNRYSYYDTFRKFLPKEKKK